MIYVAADVARKRKERDPKILLNYPEAVALITAYVLEEARAGHKTVAQLMGPVDAEVLDRADLMPGVEEMLGDIQIEATFPDGTKMVSIRHPLPPTTTSSPVHPGKIEHPAEAEPVVFNKGREVTVVTVSNDDDRPIQVGSHYHFFEANPHLTILPDRDAAYGKRLNIPAGSSMRFEPGTRTENVELVPIEGERIVEGLRGEVGGKLQ